MNNVGNFKLFELALRQLVLPLYLFPTLLKLFMFM